MEGEVTRTWYENENEDEDETRRAKRKKRSEWPREGKRKRTET